MNRNRLKELARRMLIDRTDNLFIQLFRSVFVGGTSFVFDFAVLYSLTEFAGVHYLLSSILSFIVGVTVNYLLSKVWVFDRSTFNNKGLEFGIFALIGAVGLGLTTLFMYLFTDVARFHYLFSKIVATILVYLWNFFSRRMMLFR